MAAWRLSRRAIPPASVMSLLEAHALVPLPRVPNTPPEVQRSGRYIQKRLRPRISCSVQLEPRIANSPLPRTLARGYTPEASWGYPSLSIQLTYTELQRYRRVKS